MRITPSIVDVAIYIPFNTSTSQGKAKIPADGTSTVNQSNATKPGNLTSRKRRRRFSQARTPRRLQAIGNVLGEIQKWK
jgi:hypothetical protein